jgi:hypothetical protein
MKYLVYLTLLIYVYTDCDTPLDCYLKGIDALASAREIYSDAEDKLKKIITDVQASLDKQVDDDRTKMTTLEGKLNEIKANVTTISGQVSARIGDANTKLHTLNCREAYTACADNGGGNLFNLDRHSMYCNGGEKMYGWQLQNCDNKNVRVQYNCCVHPS